MALAWYVFTYLKVVCFKIAKGSSTKKSSLLQFAQVSLIYGWVGEDIAREFISERLHLTIPLWYTDKPAEPDCDKSEIFPILHSDKCYLSWTCFALLIVKLFYIVGN